MALMQLSHIIYKIHNLIYPKRDNCVQELKMNSPFSINHCVLPIVCLICNFSLVIERLSFLHRSRIRLLSVLRQAGRGRDLLPTVIIGTTIFGYRDDGVVPPRISASSCVNIQERNTTYRKPFVLALM